MTEFLDKKYFSIKIVWWIVVFIVTTGFGIYFTLKSTVLLASETAKDVTEIKKSVIDLEKCQARQDEKNKRYDEAIVESRELFREIRNDIRALRK